VTVTLLEVRDLRKSFGGLLAVDSVNFAIEPGRITSLIGPNGAGKTTVFNLVTGVHRPDRGTILYKDRSLVGCRPHTVVELGIARTFQGIRLFPGLTALENVMAGCHCRGRAGVVAALVRSPGQRREEASIRSRAQEWLRFMRIDHLCHELARNLSYGDQRRVEVARALATGPDLVVLDEPAAGLNEEESASLVDLIRRIRERGITVFLIEHDMKVVMGVSDFVLVLDNGRLIAGGRPEEVQAHPRVIEAYLGRGAAGEAQGTTGG
jgi:branched-chain amino acid transport system ATP-binding protein